MVISETLLNQLNKQMNYEFHSSQLYLTMAAYCSAESLDGFANFFIVQAEEERYHAMKLYRYINDRGHRAIIEGIPELNNSYESVLDAFEQAFSHERSVTERIYALSDTAMNEREHATIAFLKWFIDEQVEEEAMFDTIINKLKRIDQDSNAFFMMDSEFQQRSFTAPD